MVSKTEKARAGAFVVASVVLLIGFLIFLKYYTSLEPSREYFFLYKGSVFGLDKGSKVAFSGVPVGVVKDIGLLRRDRSQIRVTLKITAPVEELPIMDDTVVSLKYVSLITGTLYVELRGGKGEKVHPPTEPIEVEFTLLDNLEKKLDRLDNQFNEILVQVSDLLNKQNRERVATVLAEIEVAAKDFDKAGTGARKVMEQVDKTLTVIHDTVEENREPIRKAATEASATLAHVSGILAVARENKTVEVATDTLKKAGQAADTVSESGKSLADTGKQSLTKLDQHLQGLKQELAATLKQAQKTLQAGEDKIDKVTDSLQEVLGQAKKTLQTGEAKLGEVAQSVRETARAATSLTKKSETVADSTNKLVTNTDKAISEASLEIRATIENIHRTSENIQQMVKSLNALVAAKGPAFSRTLDNLKAASSELKEFAGRIRNQPSSLIGRPPKDTRSFKD